MQWILLLSAGLGAAVLAWAVQRAFYDAMARYGQVYTVAAEQRLRDLFLFVDLRLLWPLACLCAMVVASLTLVAGGGTFLAVLAATVCVLSPKLLLAWARSHRHRTFEAQLPDALTALASSMRAGAGFSAALQSLAQHAAPPLAQEFAVVNREIRLGVSVQDAISQLAIRIPGEALLLLAATVRVAVRSGGPMATMLEQTAQALQANQHIRQRLSALMAQGWLQAGVMGAMPLGLMATLAWMDEAFGQALVTTSMGYLLIASVLGLECLGLWWLFRIAKAGRDG